MNLKKDSSIGWVRISVLNDAGTADGHSDAEKRGLKHYTADEEHTRVRPMFMGKTAFARSTGLTNIEKSYEVVLNRQLDVLARVEGPFDATKAQTLRETLGVAK